MAIRLSKEFRFLQLRQTLPKRLSGSLFSFRYIVCLVEMYKASNSRVATIHQFCLPRDKLS